MAIIAHTRCNSLPSVRRLKGSETTSSLLASPVSHKLDGLQDLHACSDKLVQLATEKQALAQKCNDKCIDDLLEGSLRLFDICSTAKDCLTQSKESIHELRSINQRRRGDETGFAVASAKYLTSRKMMKKTIRKALGNLKATKKEVITSSSNNNTFSMLNFLKVAEEITLSSLESLLLFITDPKGISKQSRRSIISKLVQLKRAACDSPESGTNEFQTVDAALHQSLTSHNFTSLHVLRIFKLISKFGDVHSGFRNRS